MIEPIPTAAPRSTRWSGRLVVLATLILIAGCAERETRGRALLVGVDGATAAVLDTMIAEGQLENFAALRASGASGMLRSEFPLLSPRIWTSIATGKVPEVHGIENWVHLDEAGRPLLYSSHDRRVPAIWNILSESGYTVAVVNWLMSHPPERISGVMLSDHATPDVLTRRIQMGEELTRRAFPDATGGFVASEHDTPFAEPAEWATRFADELARRDPLTDIENPFENEGQEPENPLLKYLSDIFRADQALTRTALEIERELRPDLLIVYLPGVDRVSHFLFSALVELEKIPEMHHQAAEIREENARNLRLYYRYVDQLIGKLTARYGRDDLILVVSDHGFEAPHEPHHELQGIHVSDAARDGVVSMRAPGVPGGWRAEGMSIYDVTPTLLAWFGLPTAEDMAGRVPSFVPFAITRTVRSYDSVPIVRMRDTGSHVEPEIIRELRSLGYVQ
ncbi:MAG: alkaline phosphatase family protein [Myxococcales bacterium]|nr:alkaline phosphatase family protein [Myxococcales bacterium]